MRAQVAVGFVALVLASAGAAAPAAGAGAEPAAAITCHGVVYPPYEVSDSSEATEVAFSARQVCDGVVDHTVCVKAQERYGGAWHNRSEFVCKHQVGTNVFQARTWSCASLRPGRFRTAARYEIFFPTGDVSRGRRYSGGKDLC